MMECKYCNTNIRKADIRDDEIVCQECGAAYCLEYLGYYDEGSDVRIDEGFENSDWLKKYSKEANR